MKDEPLWSKTDVMTYLGIGKDTLKLFLERKLLRCIQFNKKKTRFIPDDIREFAKRFAGRGDDMDKFTREERSRQTKKGNKPKINSQHAADADYLRTIGVSK